jgi:hypothetical protein
MGHGTMVLSEENLQNTRRIQAEGSLKAPRNSIILNKLIKLM